MTKNTRTKRGGEAAAELPPAVLPADPAVDAEASPAAAELAGAAGLDAQMLTADGRPDMRAIKGWWDAGPPSFEAVVQENKRRESLQQVGRERRAGGKDVRLLELPAEATTLAEFDGPARRAHLLRALRVLERVSKFLEETRERANELRDAERHGWLDTQTGPELRRLSGDRAVAEQWRTEARQCCSTELPGLAPRPLLARVKVLGRITEGIMTARNFASEFEGQTLRLCDELTELMEPYIRAIVDLEAAIGSASWDELLELQASLPAELP